MGKILVADVHATQQTDAVKTALRNYKTELAMQIWRPFQEIADFYLLVNIYQG